MLQNTLQRWGALHGRKIEDSAVEVWMELFVNHPAQVLEIALKEASRLAERMPTPGLLTREIVKVYEAKPWLSPHFKPTPTATEGVDKDGNPCFYWSDDPNTPAYKARECSEGRAFLALLSEMRDTVPKRIEHANPFEIHRRSLNVGG